MMWRRIGVGLAVALFWCLAVIAGASRSEVADRPFIELSFFSSVTVAFAAGYGLRSLLYAVLDGNGSTLSKVKRFALLTVLLAILIYGLDTISHALIGGTHSITTGPFLIGGVFCHGLHMSSRKREVRPA